MVFYFSRFSFIFLCSAFFAASVMAKEHDLPVEGAMRERVDFWKKIYTQISSAEAFLHDSQDLTIIYTKLSLPKGSRRKRLNLVRSERKKIKKALLAIADNPNGDLSDFQKMIKQKVKGKTPQDLYKMTRQIRYQQGLRDRYYQGLVRSYRYIDYIKRTFKKHGLPEDLMYLPHVESSFNHRAYSKVGAAGMWQFMRGTAKIYGLKMDYIIDERRDPIKSTVAAARLLQDNYRVLQEWPLAITAYNHGRVSISRGVKAVGSTDINKIIEGYEGRRFGFASKNFYATFMATVEVSQNAEQYFEINTKPKPFRYSNLKLDRPYTIDEIVQALKTSKKVLRFYNPAIRPMVFRSSLFLPKNYELKIWPASREKKKSYLAALKSIQRDERHLESDRHHIVHKGESLYSISKAYNVAMRDIIYVNKLANPSRIYVGMKIKIPGKVDREMVQTDEPPMDVSAEESALGIKHKKQRSWHIPVSSKYFPRLEEGDSVALFRRLYSLDQVVHAFAVAGESELTALEARELESTESEETRARRHQQVSLDLYDLELKKIKNKLYWLTVEPEETLGHYADWAGVSTQSIRRLNGFRFGRPISLGQKIKISLSDNQLDSFKLKRAEYHLSIQEDFYDGYGVVGTKTYRVRKGDYIQSILRRHSLPFWLLRKHQKRAGTLSMSLTIGQKIIIPQIKSKKGDEPIYMDM